MSSTVEIARKRKDHPTALTLADLFDTMQIAKDLADNREKSAVDRHRHLANLVDLNHKQTSASLKEAVDRHRHLANQVDLNHKQTSASLKVLEDGVAKLRREKASHQAMAETDRTVNRVANRVALLEEDAGYPAGEVSGVGGAIEGEVYGPQAAAYADRGENEPDNQPEAETDIGVNGNGSGGH